MKIHSVQSPSSWPIRTGANVPSPPATAIFKNEVEVSNKEAMIKMSILFTCPDMNVQIL